MNLIGSMGLQPEARLYLLNVIIVLTLIAGLGLIAPSLLRRKHKALCAGILSTTLALIVLAPFLPGLARTIGLPGVMTTWVPVDSTGDMEAVASSPTLALEQAPSYVADVEANLLPTLTLTGKPEARTGDMLLTGLLGLWALGAVIGLFHLLRGWHVLAHVLRSSTPANSEIARIVQDAARDLGLGDIPRVLISVRVSSPFSLGLFKPTIVFPNTALEPQAVAAILRHECGHFLHRHHLVGLVQTALDLLWWWHPLVRLINKQIRSDQEELCDRHAIRGDISPYSYAHCLTRLATMTSPTSTSPSNAPLQAAFLILKQGSLEGRIRTIITMKKDEMNKLTIGHKLMGCAFAGISVAMAMACILAPAHATSPQEAPPQAKQVSKAEQQLETYDFYRLIVRRAPKVKHDLQRTIKVATAVFSGREIPRRAVTGAMQLEFIAFLKTILRLGKDVEVVPGREGNLTVLASRENHQVISSFRTFSLLMLLDKPAFIHLQYDVLELTPKAFAQHAKPLLLKAGIPATSRAGFTTIARSTQQDLFGRLSRKPGVKRLAQGHMTTWNLIRCTHEQTEQIAYVKDFKITISNAKAVADPVVDVLKHGYLFTFTPARLDTKRLALLFEVDHIKAKLPIPTFKTMLGVGREGTIQLPELRTSRSRSVLDLAGHATAGLFTNSPKESKRLLVSVRWAKQD